MANSATFKIVKGTAALSSALLGLGEAMRATILEAGVKRLCAPVLVAAKRYAKRSERTGALRGSLTVKTINYKASGKAVGLVGPDRAYYRGGKKTGKLGALFGADRPANYAHLVEFGHHVVAPISGTSRRKKNAVPAKNGATWVPAKPFIRPALATTGAQQEAEFFRGIAEGFEATRKKLVKSGEHAP